MKYDDEPEDTYGDDDSEMDSGPSNDDGNDSQEERGFDDDERD